MIKYTDKEKAAIAGIISVIIAADGFIETNEIDYMGRIKYLLDISDDLLVEGQAMSTDTATEILAAMPDDRKMWATDKLMKYINKKFSPGEHNLITDLLLRCGVDPAKYSHQAEATKANP